jgi:hypothetical protein
MEPNPSDLCSIFTNNCTTSKVFIVAMTHSTPKIATALIAADWISNSLYLAEGSCWKAGFGR